MWANLPVQTSKMSVIERQNRPSLLYGESENIWIVDSLSRLPCFLRREYIMAEPTKFKDNRKIEVFIGI